MAKTKKFRLEFDVPYEVVTTDKKTGNQIFQMGFNVDGTLRMIKNWLWTTDRKDYKDFKYMLDEYYRFRTMKEAGVKHYPLPLDDKDDD